jgi:hypothetical protein
VDEQDDAIAAFLDPAPGHSDDELARMVSDIRFALMMADEGLGDFTHSNPQASGANQAARHILMDFIHRAQHGTQQSDVAIKWLASCFMKALEHENPRNPMQSFGLLPRPKGKPPDETKAFDVAAWVIVARRRGYEKAEAKDMAAAVFHTDLKTVERYMREAALEPEHLTANDETWEIHFNIPCRSKPARPLPPRRT